MIYKERSKSKELLVMESLRYRTDLHEQDQQHYCNLSKGYEGEIKFDSFSEKLMQDVIILNDLLFTVGGSTFQIDSYFIFSSKHRFYEIKNFEGDYFFEGDKFFHKNTGKEITNPLNQLARTEILLRQFLNQLGYNILIEGYLVFINPKFTCYQAPLNKPIVFPNQLERHFNELESIPSRLSSNHRLMADRMISNQERENPYTRLPDYNYEQLRKGIICSNCKSMPLVVKGRKCFCDSCGSSESFDTAVKRSIEEFKALFPNKRITTSMVSKWCGDIVPLKAIRRILATNFRQIAFGKYTYYEEKI